MQMDRQLVERVEQRAGRMMRGLEYVPSEERLRDLGLCSLEKRKLRGDVIKASKYFTGVCPEGGGRSFSVVASPRTRGNGHQLD